MRADSPHILVVRLGAMGDIIHALPAVASLKNSFPESHLTWAVEPRWLPLLDGNPYIDDVLILHRGSVGGILRTWQMLRTQHYDFAVDFQGLLKSALLAFAAQPARLFGWNRRQLREPFAAWFYSDEVASSAAHIVDRNLELAAAAGATTPLRSFPLPKGHAEGDLPAEFVLASPFAGWRAKQWPLEHYESLAALLQREMGIPLVLNLPPGTASSQGTAPHHHSGLPGLIHATRRAAAVVGVDSGPLHLAAALERPGVAIFGPTDPARNGPYGKTFRTLRWTDARTTYKRNDWIDESMRRISPQEVFEALRAVLGPRPRPTGCLV